MTSRKPKILILGYARHGKDTAAEMLSQDYGLCFTSSSQFCAEAIVRPALAAQGIVYPDTQACFADRERHRSKWYDAIAQFNASDPARLGRTLFQQFDIYCGLRNAREARALRTAGIPDLTLWIDASRRGVPPEATSSCTVTPADADVVVDNGARPSDMQRELRAVMTRHFPWFQPP